MSPVYIMRSKWYKNFERKLNYGLDDTLLIFMLHLGQPVCKGYDIYLKCAHPRTEI